MTLLLLLFSVAAVQLVAAVVLSHRAIDGEQLWRGVLLLDAFRAEPLRDLVLNISTLSSSVTDLGSFVLLTAESWPPLPPADDCSAIVSSASFSVSVAQIQALIAQRGHADIAFPGRFVAETTFYFVVLADCSRGASLYVNSTQWIAVWHDQP